MNFLSKIQAAQEKDMMIALEDIFYKDPQYTRMIKAVVDLITRFSAKFNITESQMFDMFTTHVKKDL